MVVDDEELLRRAPQEPAAFGVFYRRHAQAVLSFCVRRAGNPEAGAELTAETFAAALAGVTTFRPERGTAVAWLFGIARNQLTDYHRHGAVSARARRRVGLADIAIDDAGLERVERLASLDVSAVALSDALQELPADQRTAVVARVVQELSYDEIGRGTNVSSAVARQRVSRGLAALRQRLGSRT